MIQQQTRLVLFVFAFQLLVLLFVSLPAWRASGVKLAWRASVGVVTLLVGVALLAQQGTIPDLVTRVFAPWLLIGGLRTTYAAAYNLSNVPAPPRWERRVTLAACVVLLTLWLVDDSPNQLSLARARFLTIACPVGVITGCWLHRLWYRVPRPWSLWTRYLFTAAALSFLMNIARVLAVLSLHGPHDPLLTPVAPIAVLAMLPTSLLVAVGLILLVETRTRDRLVVANVQLTRDVETDALTGLGNRRRLENAGVTEVARARRYGWPVTVMLLDLDHFKAINDHWGHYAGDAVLREVATRCLRALRSHDVLVRWGGEEFAVLLPQCDLVTSECVAKRILESIRQTALEEIGGDRFTVSIGLAAVEPSEETIDAALQRADAALYQAKHAGRDQHVVAGRNPGCEATATGPRALSA